MKLVTPQKIAAVMALSPLPRSFAELDDLVRIQDRYGRG